MAYSWYFTREDIELKSPSREHGISPQMETKYRRDGAKFIINASNTLGLYPFESLSCVCVCMCVYVRVYVRVFVCACVYVFVHVCVPMCVCMCA